MNLELDIFLNITTSQHPREFYRLQLSSKINRFLFFIGLNEFSPFSSVSLYM